MRSSVSRMLRFLIGLALLASMGLGATAHANGIGRSPQRVTCAAMSAPGKKCEQAHCMRTRATGSVLSDVQNSWNQRSVPWSTRPPPEAQSLSSTSG